MKKLVIVAIVAVVLASLPLFAVGQITYNIGSFNFGGPSQVIEVANNTTEMLFVTIGNKQFPLIGQGGRVHTSIISFSGWEEVPITVQVCQRTETVYRFESAPAWPDNIDQPAGLPITDEFLRSRPDKDAIKHRVGAIKRFMKKQPGGRDYIEQIKGWEHLVDAHGIAPKGPLCESPITIQALTFNRVMWGAYGNVATLLTVTGGNGQYGIVNPARWVY